MNITEVTKVYDKICAEPFAWNQHSWASKVAPKDGTVELPIQCSTAFCFAGHVASNKEVKVLWGYTTSALDGCNCDICQSDSYNYDLGFEATHVELQDGSKLSVQTYAAEKLELSHWQASELFYGNNSIQRIRSLLMEYAADQGDVLELELPAWAEEYPNGMIRSIHEEMARFRYTVDENKVKDEL